MTLEFWAGFVCGVVVMALIVGVIVCLNPETSS